MQQDSCSMTPPHSPLVVVPMEILQVEEVVEELKIIPDIVSGVVLFTCQGEVDVLKPGKIHCDGPLRQCALKWLYNGLYTSDDLTVELFGYSFTAQLGLQDDMDRLFYTARKYLTQLEMSLDATFGYIPSEVSQEKTRYRQQIKELFTYIQIFLLHYMPTQQELAHKLLNQLLDHIKSLLLFIGRLSDLPPHTLATCASVHGNQCPLGGYHIYHQYLDLYWVVMETLYTIHDKYPDYKAQYKLYPLQEGDTSDLLTQCTHILLWDVVTLALPRFNKVIYGDYTKHSPFLCNCSRELVAMVIHLSQHRKEHNNKESFWSIFSTVLKHIIQGKNSSVDADLELDSDMFEVPPLDVECKDPVGFTWWILLHVAPLFGFNTHGNYDNKNIQGTSRSNYGIVVLMLKTLLKGPPTESQLRSSLRNCVHLSELWESNTEILMLLWEYYFKKLNEQFLLPGAGLGAFANQSTSASSLLEKCEKWISGDKTKLHEENSFELFVRLLCIHLGKNRDGVTSRPGGITQEWKQMKGRIYMKFHARRMQEMTDVGLHNFSRLFLSLAAVTDLQDVGGKMVDLLSLLDNLSIEKRSCVWRAVFALAQMYIEQNQDIGHIADKMAQSLATVVQDICIEGIEPSRVHNQWRLVHLYIESVQEIVENSATLTHSEYKLFSCFMGDLLKSSACRDQDMRAILSLLQTVLSRQRIATKKAKQLEVTSTVTSQHRSLCEVLWKTFYDFIKAHSTTLTPPHQLADTAAGFTLLTLDLPLSGVVESFINCFKYFAFNENVNANISCRYLCHLLPNQSAMERLALDVTNPGAALIRAWFRCAWQVPVTNDQMQELTRLMLKVPEVQGVFTQSELNTDDSLDSHLVNFIRALGVIYTNKRDLRSRLDFQKTALDYFGDVTKHMGAALRSLSAPELSATYHIGGAICKYCAHVIYIKSRPNCLFPEFIERLVLTRMLQNPKKPAPSALLTAIREKIHMFVEGFSQLGLKNDDYLKRKLSMIFQQYLTRYPVKSTTYGAHSVHPLLLSLNESCIPHPGEQAVLFRAHILQLLCTDFLILRGTTGGAMSGASSATSSATSGQGPGLQGVHVALKFLNELFDRTLNLEQLARDSDQLLVRCLEVMVIYDSQGIIKNEATNCAQLMLEALKQHPEVLQREVIVKKLEVFVSDTLKLYQVKVLKVLETVAVLNPDLLVDVIPVMSAAVKASETKRGVGVDKTLRVAYFQVLQHLDERGRAEKLGLIREAEFS